MYNIAANVKRVSVIKRDRVHIINNMALSSLSGIVKNPIPAKSELMIKNDMPSLKMVVVFIFLLLSIKPGEKI